MRRLLVVAIPAALLSGCLLKIAPFLLAPLFPTPAHCDGGITCDCYYPWVDDAGNDDETWVFCDGGEDPMVPHRPNPSDCTPCSECHGPDGGLIDAGCS